MKNLFLTILLISFLTPAISQNSSFLLGNRTPELPISVDFMFTGSISFIDENGNISEFIPSHWKGTQAPGQTATPGRSGKIIAFDSNLILSSSTFPYSISLPLQELFTSPGGYWSNTIDIITNYKLHVTYTLTNNGLNHALYYSIIQE